MIYDVIIIGAGAAGLFCGSAPEWRGCSGLILEKGKHPGRKLLMSGSGQCNITHAGSIKDFIGCYGGYPGEELGGGGNSGAKAQKKHGALLRSCLYKYNNLSLMEFLDSNRIKTTIREDGKVFPASMAAGDVLEMLLQQISENGFEIRCECAAARIEKAPPHGWRVHTSDGSYMTRSLIIATGGCSYPATGSDGSMFGILQRDLDLEVTPLKPALSSIRVHEYPYPALAGISFATAGIAIWRDGRKIAENAGSLLFTHEDLSGPAVLNISKYAEPEDMLRIDYIYPLGYEQALARLKTATHGSNAGLSGIIASEFRLPLRFCRVLTERYGDSLKVLAKALAEQELRVSSVTGFHRAMATSGGIALSQMDLTTMTAKDHPGLYIIGEALDVDGITGGYNLQFAYSSARAAAASAYHERFGR